MADGEAREHRPLCAQPRSHAHLRCRERRSGQISAFDAPDFPHGVQTRRICCVTYMLPDRLGRLCQNCGFLPISDRVALIRERLTSGEPMSDIQLFSQLKSLGEIKSALLAHGGETAELMVGQIDTLLESVFSSSRFG